MYVTLMHINPTVAANQTSRFLNIAVPDQLGILSSSLNVIRCIHIIRYLPTPVFMKEACLYVFPVCSQSP